MKVSARTLPRLHRVGYTIAVFLFVLLSTGGAPGLVYCIGADGHQGIEYASGSSCGDHPESEQGARSGDGMNPVEHCGPCVDIPLGKVSVSPPEFRGKLAIPKFQPPRHVIANLLLLSLLQSLDPQTPFSNAGAHLGGISPVLVALRTTLLQI